MTLTLILASVVVLLLVVAAWTLVLRREALESAGQNSEAARTGAALAPASHGAPQGPPQGRRFRLAAPDDSGRELLGEVVDGDETLLFGHEAAGVVGLPIAWNGIAQGVPTIAGALSKGEVVRIIGPQHLIDGIRAGALDPTLTSTGAIGVVKGPDGKFVGQLRFESAQEAAVPASVAGPLLLFQAASVVTMQYYLHQITSRLVVIQQGIDELKRALTAQTAGQVRGAQSMVRDLEAFGARGVPLSVDDRPKLQHAEAQVRQAYETLMDRCAHFDRQVKAAVADDGSIRPKVKADDFKRLLGAQSEEAARDALLAAEAIAVRLRIARLRALAETDAAPERQEVVRENLQRELDELRAAFGSLHAPFDRLNVRREAVDRRWLTSVDAELENHRHSTKGLRALLRTPVRRVLPPPTPEQPWLVELRQGPHGVESRYAVLEATVEEVPA